MSARPSAFLIGVVGVVGCVALGVAACGGPGANEPGETTPKSNLPLDRTEVTMEVSTATPPPMANPPAGATAPVATAAPAPTASEPDDPSIGGPQADPAVEQAVAPMRSRLGACHKKAKAADPSVGGNATFDATIGKDGRVAAARLVKRDGLNEEMVGCLLTVVKAMTFEPTKKSQIVTLSFGSPPAPADADAGAKR